MDTCVEVTCYFFSFEFREDFKFYSEMDEIFRKELKADKPASDTSVDEPDDYTLVPSAQNKGETSHLNLQILAIFFF